ncbi:lipoate--protein ligase family protein [Brevibacterium album]|uniref:lipoate--protein ligase family protein n=1 Tax=Brevibacterium album TaxID=417948 RepID=UPI000413F761|nr:lipoate--protein ligase family protein [Brevibacterium album]
MKPPLTLLRHGPGEALHDLSLARALLDSVRSGERGAVLRIYRPAPTAAFGARDRFLDGFPAAVEAARAEGFTPALRTLGGRIAAYHGGSLVIDHIEPTGEFLTETQDRFVRFGEMYAAALRTIGVDARMGEIPGEYCPGEHSVNVGGRIKAIGTAQRVVSGAWLFSSSVIVEDPAPVRSVLTAVQAALGVDWEPETGGAISELHPGISVEAVEAALLRSYSREFELTEGGLTAADARAAAAYVPKHRLPGTGEAAAPGGTVDGAGPGRAADAVDDEAGGGSRSHAVPSSRVSAP